MIYSRQEIYKAIFEDTKNSYLKLTKIEFITICPQYNQSLSKIDNAIRRANITAVKMTNGLFLSQFKGIDLVEIYPILKEK